MDEKHITEIVNNREMKQRHEDTIMWYNTCISECIRAKMEIARTLKQLEKRIQTLKKGMKDEVESYEKKYSINKNKG